MKIYSKIGALTTLLVTFFLAISSVNKNRVVSGVFTLVFLFGGMAFIIECIKDKQILNKD